MEQLVTRLAACAAMLAPGLALAQGSDLCSTAQAISGVGLFPFDNAAAASDGVACSDHDVWFRWTAPSSGNFLLATCNQTTVDTFLAAYSDLTCPPSVALDCSDDSCGAQSQMVIAATAGVSYLIELGTPSGMPGGTGNLRIGAFGAGGCASPSQGPDVIVGDISGTSNYGQVNGVYGYALGTTSCNVGTEELDWIANDPNHPVIGQNIYRLNDGRFEHIGQSWLKHGFTALQLSVCCSCISSGTGARLGVGCADPYGAGLNGLQAGLGPRSEVNATTGAFVYPFGSQGQSGDTIYKRIQVDGADLSAVNYPNATYYAECQYVAPDDAAAGNGANNASWRPLSRAGFDLDVTGTTRRAQPAVLAWQAADPTVDVQTVDLPNEGRLWVASNCYVGSGGTYRYEYVVFNLNSHRSVGAFTVPVGQGAQVVNMGMSFPRSHSGEPFDNTAWTPTFLGDCVEWRTASHATNPNANAIRWGTTYSFWFESTNAPEVKRATLGLFRPGTQADPLVTVCGPVGGMGAPSVTNYCTAAPNSTGLTGAITAQNIDLNTRSMELTAANLPAGVPAISLAARQQGNVPNAGGGTGTLCLGGGIGRAVGGSALTAGATGALSERIDLDAIPTPTGSTAVLAGEPWHFQYWFRDSVLGIPTSNFTNGVRVVFP